MIGLLLSFVASIPFIIPAHRGDYRADFPAQKNYLNVVSQKEYKKLEKSLKKRKLLEIVKVDTLIQVDTIVLVDTAYLRELVIDTVNLGYKGVQVLTYKIDEVKPNEDIEVLGDSAVIFSSTCNLGTNRWNTVLAGRRADYVDSVLSQRGVKVLSKSFKIKLGRFTIVLWR